jgi:hypothetical protein
MKRPLRGTGAGLSAWRIAPGERAEAWELSRERGCIALGWKGIKDFRRFGSRQELDAYLKRERERSGHGRGSMGAEFIWRFVHEVAVGDIVVANMGQSRVVGVGRVTGDYLPRDAPDNPVRGEAYPHARTVDWLVDAPVFVSRNVFGHHPRTITELDAAMLEKVKRAYAREYRADPELAAALAGLNRTAARRPRPRDDLGKVLARQGFASSPAVRRAIEDRAMALARKICEKCGYVVEDVSRQRSYDLHCTKRGLALFVEVKGTGTDGDAILLTPNEVELARRRYPHTELVIVSGISVKDKAGLPVASGGRTRVIPKWRPAERDLKPVGYTCDVSRFL